MVVNLESYRDMLKQPWGKIQYEITFAQLKHLKGLKILDFGSGFGLVSKFLSTNNEVIAVEPNRDMLYADKNVAYERLLGGIEQLVELQEKSFDVIICHNVLEYILPADRVDYLNQFKRLLKDNGRISIIKHNQAGKVMQSVVFSNDVETALSLLSGKSFHATSFTQGSTYTIDELLDISGLRLEKYMAIRTFSGLQPNEFKSSDEWLEELTKVELAVCDLKPYKDISFLQHVWLTLPSANLQ